MRNGQGGTQKWCPTCKAVRVCAAFNPAMLAAKAGQRWRKTSHSDVQWFRRALECQHCGEKWLTAEIEERFLDELVELRDALADLKLNAEKYIKESSAASKSLSALSKSLSVLRSLESVTEE
jgi:hypothetical protein